jgi:hypothetical protein
VCVDQQLKGEPTCAPFMPNPMLLWQCCGGARRTTMRVECRQESAFGFNETIDSGQTLSGKVRGVLEQAAILFFEMSVAQSAANETCTHNSA